ncbi:MAG: transporter ATP-binding protein [Bacteroidetes bacterium]|nr:transporter ATP-binding protein [Bacteroidota bacterium]MBP1776656.1 transporter ATP-binding protein [candidate division NC10 bacterium]
MDPLLSVSQLKTYFYTSEGVAKAVDDVSFAVGHGETVGLVGESGCGKSVTALSIMRLVDDPPGKIAGGEIRLEGKNLLEVPRPEMRQIRGRDISMIFQEPMTSLNPVFTIGSQVSEAIRFHQRMQRGDIRDKSIELLKLVGIPSPERRISDYPHHLSGGMRQRIMIAMALACNPKVLIADEPTTALDVTIQAQIMDLMAGLQEKLKTAILLITHDLGLVAETTRRVIVMYLGKVVESAATAALFDEPLHPYTQGLMRSIPQIHEKHSKTRTLWEIPGNVPSLIDLPPGCPFTGRCDRRMARCAEAPPLLEITPQHWVRCWLYGQTA